jgi:hypothetical protein
MLDVLVPGYVGGASYALAFLYLVDHDFVGRVDIASVPN